MQLETESFLELVMNSKPPRLCCFDIEATGLRGDYNSILTVSIKPYKQKPYSITVKQPGNDQKLVKEVKVELEKYLCWVTYYGRGYDIKMINTRLTRWGLPPVEKRHHIDMYFKLGSSLLTARRSQAHLLRFFGCEEQKMDMSAEEWNEVLATANLKRMIERCESDTRGLEALFEKTHHLVRDVTL